MAIASKVEVHETLLTWRFERFRVFRSSLSKGFKFLIEIFTRLQRKL